MRLIIINLCVFFMACCVCGQTQSHLIFHQDVFHGGVSAMGYNPTWNTDVPGNVDVFIEPGSSIRKAYLLVGVEAGFFGKRPNQQIAMLNGIPVLLDTVNTIGDEFTHITTTPALRRASTVFADVTDAVSQFLSGGLNSVTISPPELEGFVIPDGRFAYFYLYVEYENPSMPKVNSVILINQLNAQLYQNYAIDNLNTIDMTNDIGIAVKSSHICYSSAYPTDGTFVYVNGDSLGLIKGQDENAFHECAGVMGSYYYQNNTLYGLSDDTANYTMHNSDGLANIQPSLNASNSFELFLEYENPNSGYTSNPFFSFYLAYSTPCDTFEVTISEDTEICVDSSVQLEATGGIDYEWEPATGLSCTDCPNPTASPEESTTYTVRIFNTEECSKVLPVRVRVNQPPQDINFTTTPSVCGEANGSITVTDVESSDSPFWYSFNGVVQSSPYKSGLEAGSHTLRVVDANGCSSDIIPFTIEEENHAQAGFEATPVEGESPLTAFFSNQSSNVTDYIWIIEGDTILGDIESYTFEESGEFEVQLIAYNNEEHCADTAFGEIVVHPEYLIHLPNIFSPNGDGVNDLLTAKVMSAARLQWQVFNRWGNLMHEQEQQLDETEQTITLWDGTTLENKPASEGTYFLTLTATDYQGEEHTEKVSVRLVR